MKISSYIYHRLFGRSVDPAAIRWGLLPVSNIRFTIENKNASQCRPAEFFKASYPYQLYSHLNLLVFDGAETSVKTFQVPLCFIFS